MHRLTIVFGPASTMWGLLFKDKARAERCFDALKTEPSIDIVDDFGQRACLKSSSINGFMLENLEEARVAGVELLAHNGRIEMDARNRLMQRGSTLVPGGGLPSFSPVPTN